MVFNAFQIYINQHLSGMRIFDGIADQILENLVQSVIITKHSHWHSIVFIIHKRYAFEVGLTGKDARQAVKRGL